MENVIKESNANNEARAPVHRYRLQVREVNGACRTYQLSLRSLDDRYTLEIHEMLDFPDAYTGESTPVHLSRPVNLIVSADDFYRYRRDFRSELTESVAAALRAGEVVRMRQSPCDYPAGVAGNPWVNRVRADLRAYPGGYPHSAGDDMQDLIGG
ncbi:hypothetical protein WS70_27230 [Burkholderia mayonis]|uniref:Uncharacterized protein n=1 Tax=Burkholderia mayonis TaxID=1385591 RepID=A0A1B4FP05_9BURK|nr:hypothetical protein WS70_27230 [Burkholderia mayonis]KVE47902.1 hypothetical protein WS70_25530 [Burkholderia mayonis]